MVEHTPRLLEVVGLIPNRVIPKKYLKNGKSAVVEWLASGISKLGVPGSIPQLRTLGGVPLGKAYFLA